MIIRIKKRKLILALMLIVLSLPIAYAVASVVKVNFKVELVISNRNPVINFTNATIGAVDPTAAGTTNVLISFNVSDADGVNQINASTTVVNFTLGVNSQWYANVSAIASSEFGTCGNTTISDIVVINCTVALPYFVNASANWVVNISVKDKIGGKGTNDTIRFTVNTISGLALPYTAINFSSVNVGQQNVLAYPHLLINNTGNDDFSRVNISASALVGTTTTSENIAVTNFGVNTTNSSANNRGAFPAGGVVALTDVNSGTFTTLNHGHTSDFAPNTDKGNISVFVWVNVPSSGLSPQLYNATWNVTATSSP